MQIRYPYLNLIRPWNCIMGSIAVLTGIFIGIGPSVSDYWVETTIALILVFIFMAGANALNDYFDRIGDRINHPERMLPSGRIKPENALYLAYGLIAIAVGLGIFINLIAFMIVCIAACLIISYEMRYKQRGLVGNIIISVLVALLFIFGGAVVDSYSLNIVLAILAFLANLAREIVKDIEDIKGDMDRFTLPKKIGIGSAANSAAAALAVAILISPLPYFPDIVPQLRLSGVGLEYLSIVIIADLIFILSINDFRNKPKQASLLLKIGMVVALLAFLTTAIVHI